MGFRAELRALGYPFETMCGRTIHLRSILVALVIGIITTTAIAWIAMFIPHGEHGFGPPTANELGVVADESGEHLRYLQLWEGRTATHHVVSYWWMQISGQSLMFTQPYDYESRKVDLTLLPDHLRPDSLGEIMMHSWYREVGWPMKALTCAVHWKDQIRNEDIIYRVEGGIQLSRDAKYQPRALPLIPLWPGFVVNTLLFGGIWFLCSTTVQALRARRRLKRNLCPRCGYSQVGLAAGSLCPECGSGATC